MKQSITIDEAAKILGLCRKTIYRLITSREIVAYRVRSVLRITAESVTAYQERQILSLVRELDEDDIFCD
jgi:excisionase family DNA binding protein